MFVTNLGKEIFEHFLACYTISHDVQQKIVVLSVRYRAWLNGDYKES